MQISWVITLLHNTVGSVLCRYLGHYFAAQYCRQRTMQISWSLLCCTILQAAYYVDILVVTLLHNIVGSVLCRYLGHYFAAQYCRQRTMQISWSLLCCTILQAAYYVDIFRQCTRQISWSLLCCTILQAVYYVDILVITLLHQAAQYLCCCTILYVLCRYLGHYFAAQYCRQRTMQISWSLLCCTILQAAYYVDILVVTLLHNIVGSVLCRYLGHYFAAQYCRQRTMQISWSLLCCTILQAAYYVDILVITLLHNIVGSVLCRYLGHYFAAKYCRQCTMQISWSLLCCTILQAAYYVDILVITLLHNIVGSVLCRYLGHYFAAQYCRQRTMQISWSLLCCTILQAAYYIDILVITLLHNTCRQRTMQISWSLLCCTILQAAYYVDILVVTLLHNIVDSVLCRYLGHYFAAQYCRQRTMQISWSLLCCTILQAAYYVDILVVTLLHNTVGSVLCRYLGHYFAAQYCRQRTICRYLGHYFAAQYCRQRTMQISWSLLCCTILQAAYYVDILVVTLLHNTVAYYVDILVVTLLHNIVGSVQISWSLLCCTILQAAYYVDILVITLLHNIVGSVLCRYLGRYFAAQYCRQRTMQISWSLLCCTILQAAYYVDILVITLLHNIVGSVLCRYLGHYFAAQYCRQRTMDILVAAYYVDILVVTLLHNIVGSVLCRYLVITLLHNTVGSVLCRYLGHYFAAQYCRQRTMQISWSLFCCTILQAAYYVDILVITLLHNIVGSVLCRYLGHYFAAQYLQAAYYVDILVITLLHNTVGSVLCRYLGHYFAAQYCRQRTMQISWSLLCCTILQAAYYVDILVITLLHNIVGQRTMQISWSLLYCTICRQRTMQISWSLLCCTILQAAYYVDILVVTLLHNIVGCTILQAAYYVDILVITLLHNTVGSVLCRYLGHYFAAQYCSSVLCRYLGHYFAAQYCRQRTMQISWSLLCCTILQAAYYVDILVFTLLHNTVGSVLCRYLGHYFAAQYCRQRTMQISWSLLCCTILQVHVDMQILQAAYYVDILVITLLHNTVGSVLCRYLGHYFAAQYCRQRTMQISWSLLCCTILQAAYYVDILVITLLHNIVGSVLLQISWSLLCCTILQAAYYVDILVITLLHNTVGSVLCRYLGHYFAAQYCRQRTMQISWSLLCCTILQAAYYVDILVVTLLHNIVGSVLCRYLGHYFAAQYCRQRTMQISLAAYYVILVVTLLHNIVGSVLCRYLGHYFAAQYCRQRTMQISWSLLCCTILQAAYYVDILVITLLHNIVGSVLCRYLGHYFAAQYCRQRTMQISWSLLCCTILQAAYYVDILVITLLHNIVGSVLCRYLGHYFAAQYCRQRTMQISWSLLHNIVGCTMQISWSLLCCTILQVAYYVDILVITLLHNIVGSVLCRYLGRYFAAQYCRQRTMQISWSFTLLHNIVGSVLCRYLVVTLLHNIVLCRYLGHYFAAQYCTQRTIQIQRTMQISWSLLCCTIMQAAYYVDILVITLLHRQRTMQISWSLLCCTILQVAYYVDILFITLLHNIVSSVLCRYLGRYFAAQYCRQRTMQISWSCNMQLSQLYSAAQYCRQRTLQISWSLLCCTILQAAYYVDILVVTLLHNTVGSVLCRYLGHYFAAQYCRQRTMQISWSLLCCTILQAAYYVDILVLLCCTILQAAYYVDILVVTLLHNIVGSVLCRYLGHYFAAQYCRQRTAHNIVVSVLCRYLGSSVLCRYLGRYFAAQYCRQRTMQISWSLLCCTILQAAYYVDILVITLLHNIVGSVLCRYLGHYFAAQYCRQRTMQISWSLLCCTILQAAYYVDILVITLLHNIVGSVLCRYLGHYFAAQYCRQRTMQISWSLLCCTILQAAYYVDILVITLLHNIVGSVLCRYLGHYFAAQQYVVGSVLCRYLGRYFAAQYCRQRTMQISWSLLCCTILQAAYYVDILVITLLHMQISWS